MDNNSKLMPFVATVNVTCFDIVYAGIKDFPSEGQEVYSSDFKLLLGGGSPASLITLSKLGIPVKVATYLGDDLFSQLAHAEYCRLGVEPANLYSGCQMPVTVSTAISTAKDRTFVSFNGDSGFRAEDDEVYAVVKGARLVYVNEKYPEVNKRLRQDGAVLFYDTGFCESDTVEAMREILSIVDYYTPNYREAARLTGESELPEILRRLSELVRNPIVKLDKDGCAILVNGEVKVVPIIQHFKRVDTTGAGDAFMAGLMFGVYHGHPLAECVLMGNITGGKAVTGIGCLAAFFDGAQLMEEFQEQRHLLE